MLAAVQAAIYESVRRGEDGDAFLSARAVAKMLRSEAKRHNSAKAAAAFAEEVVRRRQ